MCNRYVSPDQAAIERFWTLRWLQQNEVAEIEAGVMKDGLVRAETLPLVFRLPGTESLPRGSRVRARITGIDLLTLELFASLAARLDAPAEGAPIAEEASEEDETEAVTTVQLAIAVDETPANGDEAPAASAEPS